jgi:hypothetical protein
MAEVRRTEDRLANPAAFLTRSDLAALGLTRTAVDYVFRACPTVHFAGVRRPFVQVKDYLSLIEQSTYRGDRVRP